MPIAAKERTGFRRCGPSKNPAYGVERKAV
jgi:hypothetical protein